MSQQRPTKREGRIGQCDPHDVYEHPAFGVVGMTIVQGGNSNLFGSDISHNQRIRIHVKKAELHRTLSRDWIHAGGNAPLIEIEMSHSQFAEFITTPNHGEGLPCTIKYMNGKDVPAIEQIESKQDMLRREIEESAKKRIQKALEEVERLGALIDSGKTPKTELKAIHRDLQRELSYLPGSVSYVVEQANEALEKATIAARMEIEASVNYQISRAGIEAVRAAGVLGGASVKELRGSDGQSE